MDNGRAERGVGLSEFAAGRALLPLGGLLDVRTALCAGLSAHGVDLAGKLASAGADHSGVPGRSKDERTGAGGEPCGVALALLPKT